MEKKYTKTEIEEMINKAIAKTMEEDAKDLEEAMREHDGKVDSTKIMAMTLKNMLLLSEFHHFFWEAK